MLQKLLRDHYFQSLEMKIQIDQLSLTTLNAVPKFNQIELSSATAFSVFWNSQPYLIINWHVVTGCDPDTGLCLDKKYAALPNRLSVHFYAKGKLGTWKVVDLPLVESYGMALWLEHPLKAAIDVVAIPINH